MPDPNQKPDPQVVGLDAARLGLSVPSGAGGEETLEPMVAILRAIAIGSEKGAGDSLRILREAGISGSLSPAELHPKDGEQVVKISIEPRPFASPVPVAALVIAASAATRVIRETFLASLPPSPREDEDREEGTETRPEIASLRLAGLALESALLEMTIPALGPTGPRSLPEYLAASRTVRGLSFESWAGLLRVHPATVRRWEGGATLPGFEDLRRLVEIGLDPTVLLGLPARRET